jgi:sulfatase maturation enzyme AslB (radical SAM superfamily)
VIDRVGKKLIVGNINKQIFYRDEHNGISFYNKKTNIYKFYKNLSWHELEHTLQKDISIERVNSLLESNKHLMNLNVKVTSPFAICWLIEDSCNLDCIYCFADDKLQLPKKQRKHIETAHHILSLDPIVVGISGGEPTLNSNLVDILEVFSGKVAVTLDSNGTTNIWDDLIPILKEGNVLVRMTIDSLDNSVLNTIRPRSGGKSSNFDQITLIKSNLLKLKSSNIPVMIHTVLTQKNIGKTKEIGEFLLSLGIDRWHLYGVNYSLKCKDIFSSIKVDETDIINNQNMLLNEFGDKIFITHSLENDYGASVRVMVNSNGEFFTDTIFQGLKFIGKDINKPTKDELCNAININRHIECYLGNFKE